MELGGFPKCRIVWFTLVGLLVCAGSQEEIQIGSERSRHFLLALEAGRLRSGTSMIILEKTS